MENKFRNLGLIVTAVVAVLGFWVAFNGLKTVNLTVDFIHESSQKFNASITAAESMDYPMNATTTLEAAIIYNNAVDIALFVFWTGLGVFMMGSWIFVAGLMGFIKYFKKIPSDRERIRALEQNQKTIVDHQDRMLKLFEAQRFLKRAEAANCHAARMRMAGKARRRQETPSQPRDSHGRFKRKGVKK